MTSPQTPRPDELFRRIAACRICADRFAATATAHEPRPVLRARPGAPILIVGQAPGARVHASGLPFDDPSGDRLRDWMGIGREVFYDQDRVAIVPMAFCFPGYDAKGSDLPPPPVCAKTWRAEVMAALPDVRLTLIIGQYAQKWHLGAARAKSVTETVRDWRARLALARHLRDQGRAEEAYGLLLRAVEANPQVLIIHLEAWRTLRRMGVRGDSIERYVATAEHAVFYRDPHICTACRYRADDMLWRCPHCHEWNTLVEERLDPIPIRSVTGVA